ncbi:uncharacterized protein LOC143677474 [Tamandua tetradactyla]|uniref:uncharacterized protein LOC143677474 n=1 Tax=Tamandua tetradactyla TaxID=48850 RepID=UPI00405499D7
MDPDSAEELDACCAAWGCGPAHPACQEPEPQRVTRRLREALSSSARLSLGTRVRFLGWGRFLGAPRAPGADPAAVRTHGPSPPGNCSDGAFSSCETRVLKSGAGLPHTARRSQRQAPRSGVGRPRAPEGPRRALCQRHHASCTRARGRDPPDLNFT